jgi:endonuclease III
MQASKLKARKARAKKIVAFLKKRYPDPKTELHFRDPFQLVVAVLMSAQCTDKVVNRVTEPLFKKYKTAKDFARADLRVLTKEISSVTFFRNKAKAIIAAAQIIENEFKGVIPKTIDELSTLPGVAYKTATVVLGELYDMWDGIPTDAHVRRFAYRFDLSDHTDLFKISKDLEAIVAKKDWKYVNNGFVLYGRYICKAHKHDCSQHELTALWPQSRTRWQKPASLR